MTEKLYYADPGRFSFDARVLECREGAMPAPSAVFA